MFKSTNNYKDYFFNTNEGQSLPLMSLILIPFITLFLSYSTLVSSSEKNKDNVTKKLESVDDDSDTEEGEVKPETPKESIKGGKKNRKTKRSIKKRNRKTKRH